MEHTKVLTLLSLFVGLFFLVNVKSGYISANETELAHPVVFARYNSNLNLAPHDQTACLASSLYVPPYPNHLNGTTDFCGPVPYLSKSDTKQEKGLSWTLPEMPTSFIWQHLLQTDQRLTLELLDSSGLPWPSVSSLLASGSPITTVQLQPTIALPNARPFFLVATLYDKQDKRLETWPVSLVLSQTTAPIKSASPLPWAPTPSPVVVATPAKVSNIKKIPKHKKKPKRHRQRG